MKRLVNDDYGMIVLRNCTTGDYRTFQEYLQSEENDNLPKKSRTAVIGNTIYSQFYFPRTNMVLQE
jgi:hypothetical protein